MNNSTGLYIIYSRWSLPRIDRFISDYGKIGLLRVVNDGSKETNRTLSLMENEAYGKLVASGYSGKNNKGFSISPFNDKALESPGKNYNSNLFVPVPECLKSDDLKVIDMIEFKLKHLVDWEILPDNCWNINALLKSREKGGISKGCFIIFGKELEISTISKARMLLTDNTWPALTDGDQKEVFKCMWGLDLIKDKKVKNDKNVENNDDKKKKRPSRPMLRRKLETFTNSDSDDEEVKKEETTKISMPVILQPLEILNDIVSDDSV